MIVCLSLERKQPFRQIFLLEQIRVTYFTLLRFLQIPDWLVPSYCRNQHAALSNLFWYLSKPSGTKRKPPHLISGLAGKQIPSIYLAKHYSSGWDRWNVLLPSVAALVMLCEVFNYVRNLCSEKVDHSDEVFSQAWVQPSPQYTLASIQLHRAPVFHSHEGHKLQTYKCLSLQ